MSSGGGSVANMVHYPASTTGIRLTDADLGKKFRTRDGDIVTLVWTPDDEVHKSVLKTHPYSYVLDGSYEAVRSDGGWLHEEDDSHGCEYDIVARVEDEPIFSKTGVPQVVTVRRNCIPIPAGSNLPEFVTKDSGARQSFESGMVRDTTAGKTHWHRVADGPMLKRWAELLTRGAEKYPDVSPGEPNWTLAKGEAELFRFRESAFRHFMSWFRGDVDEDHAAAVLFNINGAEFVLDRMENGTLA